MKMNNSVVIVPAKEEHLQAAGDIAIAAWTPIRAGFRDLLGDELYEAQFANWQEAKRNTTCTQLMRGRGYVALLDGKVVGYISYHIHEETKTGEIVGNAVSAEARGMGIGPKMYQFVLDKMREEGMIFARVHTGLDDGHAPARRAYEKAGFEKNLPSVDYFMKL